jgi:hypothetical protein
MSIKLMSAIFGTEMHDLPYFKNGEQRKAKASTVKLVLLSLADHANDYGESCFPGYDKMEIKTCLSRQGLADTYDALVENGILTVDYKASRLGTNDYNINIRAFPAMADLWDELPQTVKPLDSQQSSHLTQTVKPLDHNHQVTINKTSMGAESAAPMPLDWKIAHNEEITQLDISSQTFDAAAARDAADLIEMQCPGGGPLALAFMVARKIIFPESKIKGQRKAARDLLSQGVRPEHVQQAVQELTAKSMTVVDLFSVTRTAVSIAHPPEAQGYNPQGLVVGV